MKAADIGVNLGHDSQILSNKTDWNGNITNFRLGQMINDYGEASRQDQSLKADGIRIRSVAIDYAGPVIVLATQRANTGLHLKPWKGSSLTTRRTLSPPG